MPRNSTDPLKTKDIAGLADYIKSERCKNVVFMLGAGISTSAGIPDFRSPETGLYANLARLKLPYPEAVFEINFFRRDPKPFYTLAHELYPGQFRPTPTHSFVRLFAEKKLLQKCFTQNIDTLERQAGVPGDKIIEAHGSFATQRCIDCRKPHEDAEMKRQVLAKEIPKCPSCKGLVKPDIVFFGESLPDEFTRAIPSVGEADLLIIIGTSLTVHPFAGLAQRVLGTCPRVLINFERVGTIGHRPNDLVLLGKCDEIVRDLCRELGWEKDLDRLWAETKSVEKKSEQETGPGPEPEPEPESAADLVETITEAIGKQLNLDETADEESDDEAAGDVDGGKKVEDKPGKL
ncbi:unnamed protein product [Mycena citricolor]|uniref:NAD-dependent protein deacetylase n=1 Tax=Mycena citricolor TaxID=2018698 RepID=A0AAD2H983_9AGAR|nr:unnamed protein product [Mycena citricolor]CAK5283969.1 unnamed protein product [Mycena citricolor]